MLWLPSYDGGRQSWSRQLQEQSVIWVTEEKQRLTAYIKREKNFFPLSLNLFCVSSNVAIDSECPILGSLEESYQRSFSSHLPPWLLWVVTLRGCLGREKQGREIKALKCTDWQLQSRPWPVTSHSSSQTRCDKEIAQHPWSWHLHPGSASHST